MSNILTIAYSTEGPTDKRFLENIIRKVFEDAAYKCESNIEVFDPVFIKFPRENTFVEDVLKISSEAHNIGMNVVCIHVDADSDNDKDVMKNKIIPALEAVRQQNDNTICKNLVSVIPVQMTEAWMLADKELLKDEINTNKSDIDLGINREPELIADPKKVIEDALNVAQSNLPKRRNRITIGDLYQPLGQKIAMDKLETLNSFNKFKLSVEDALKRLNY